MEQQMSLNPHLQELVDNDKLGFEDVFELYAVLAVNHIRDVTNDLIEDLGIQAYLKTDSAITPDELTTKVVDWCHNTIPEMTGDGLTGDKDPDESWLQFVIRRKVELHVQESESFQIKVV